MVRGIYSSLTLATVGFGRCQPAGSSPPSRVAALRGPVVTAVWRRLPDSVFHTEWRRMVLETFSSLIPTTRGFGRCRSAGPSSLSLEREFRGSAVTARLPLAAILTTRWGLLLTRWAIAFFQKRAVGSGDL